MDPETANSLATHGFLGSYTVEMPTYTTSTVGSVLLVTVTSNGSGGVEHTLNGVIGAIRTRLATLQSGIQPGEPDPPGRAGASGESNTRRYAYGALAGHYRRIRAGGRARRAVAA